MSATWAAMAWPMTSAMIGSATDQPPALKICSRVVSEQRPVRRQAVGLGGALGSPCRPAVAQVVGDGVLEALVEGQLAGQIPFVAGDIHGNLRHG